MEEKRVATLYARTDLLKVISEYLSEAIPLAGHVEDHFWENIRILLCIACCSFGCYAQFGTKFPKDIPIIFVCVCGYFVFSGILGLIDYFVIKQSIMHIRINN